VLAQLGDKMEKVAQFESGVPSELEKWFRDCEGILLDEEIIRMIVIHKNEGIDMHRALRVQEMRFLKSISLSLAKIAEKCNANPEEGSNS
jgi:hypothetical protein